VILERMPTEIERGCNFMARECFCDTRIHASV
jgi:hypothetical protein